MGKIHRKLRGIFVRYTLEPSYLLRKLNPIRITLLYTVQYLRKLNPILHFVLEPSYSTSCESLTLFTLQYVLERPTFCESLALFYNWIEIGLLLTRT